MAAEYQAETRSNVGYKKQTILTKLFMSLSFLNPSQGDARH
jgi:hypothetical protein